jgi:hydroxymethylpyrimidine/phosphomethylpyrimidine kinase
MSGIFMTINAEITPSMKTTAILTFIEAKNKYTNAIHNCQSDYLKMQLDIALTDVIKLIKIFESL